MANILDEAASPILDEAAGFVTDEAGSSPLPPPPGTTSRTIVRAGVAQFFGGTTYDPIARAYRGSGPLASAGLSTVRAYPSKRISDKEYVMEAAEGRGMGAAMVVELPKDREYRVGLGGAHSGEKRIDYDTVLAVFHLAHMQHAEDAGQDVDLLIEAIKDQIRSDRTLGGICIEAGETQDDFARGIEVDVGQPEVFEERVLTSFTIAFSTVVYIVA